MSTPQVSVLMPCHNSAQWLRPAIESVLNQTMGNLELILVDNGSIDDTVSIAEGYASRDSRVLIIRQGDLGPAIARNRARGIAKGIWIATLDSDDLAEPSRLERQLALASRDPKLALVGSGFIEIDAHGEARAVHLYPCDDRALSKRLTRLQGFFPHSSALYKRDVADRLGGYRVEVGYAEDWDFWLRLAEVGPLACLPEPLVRVRKHAGQMSLEGNGRLQLVHACAATVAHFLRRAGEVDPITCDKPERDTYLAWVEKKMLNYGYFAQRSAWAAARARAINSSSRLRGLSQFAVNLIHSSHAPALLGQKLFGSELPERLAKEWRSGVLPSVPT